VLADVGLQADLDLDLDLFSDLEEDPSSSVGAAAPVAVVIKSPTARAEAGAIKFIKKVKDSVAARMARVAKWARQLVVFQKRFANKSLANARTIITAPAHKAMLSKFMSEQDYYLRAGTLFAQCSGPLDVLGVILKLTKEAVFAAINIIVSSSLVIIQNDLWIPLKKTANLFYSLVTDAAETTKKLTANVVEYVQKHPELGDVLIEGAEKVVKSVVVGAVLAPVGAAFGVVQGTVDGVSIVKGAGEFMVDSTAAMAKQTKDAIDRGDVGNAIGSSLGTAGVALGTTIITGASVVGVPVMILGNTLKNIACAFWCPKSGSSFIEADAMENVEPWNPLDIITSPDDVNALLGIQSLLGPILNLLVPPPGEADEQNMCILRTADVLQLDVVPPTCDAAKNVNGACYTPCAAGYTTLGSQCMPTDTCAGVTSAARCWDRLVLSKQDVKRMFTRTLESTVCPAGAELSMGMCVKSCKGAAVRMGPFCVPTAIPSCPADWITCGMYCTKTIKQCGSFLASVVFNAFNSAVKIAGYVASAGATFGVEVALEVAATATMISVRSLINEGIKKFVLAGGNKDTEENVRMVVILRLEQVCRNYFSYGAEVDQPCIAFASKFKSLLVADNNVPAIAAELLAAIDPAGLKKLVRGLMKPTCDFMIKNPTKVV